jgi:hypothetical protein
MPKPAPKIESKKKDGNLFLKLFPFLLGLVLIGAGVAAYYFIFSPAMARLKPGGDLDLAAKQEELDAANRQLSQIKRLQENFGEIQSDENFEKINFGLPTTADLPGLFVQLEAIVTQNGLSVQGLEITEAIDAARPVAEAAAPAGSPTTSVLPSPPAGVKKLNINLRVGAADYSGWKSFLESIEKNLRLFDVISYSFDPRSNQQSINLVTYYMKD